MQGVREFSPEKQGISTTWVACSRLREHVRCVSEHGHASEAMPPNAVNSSAF